MNPTMKHETTIRAEEPREILGVPGRAGNVIVWPGNGSAKAPRELANQGWASETRRWEEHGQRIAMRVNIRHDDKCRNGHPSFAVTVDGWTNGRADWGGAAHDEVAKHFPELAPLLPWHLCSTDGPMHYIANSVYLAGDRDHNGLRKGERYHIRNGRTGLPAWRLECIGPDGKPALLGGFGGASVDAEERPQLRHKLEWRPMERIGEGKARELDLARRAAVWPDATDSQLMAPKEELTAALEARLPALLARFRAMVEGDCGMIWDAASVAPVAP